MSLRPDTLRVPLAVAAVGLLLAGCTVGQESTSPAPAATATSTPASISASPGLTASASPTTVSPTLGSVATPSDSATPGAPATPALISAQPGSSVTLGLGVAFHADGWTEGTYQAASGTASAPAIAATVNCNSPAAEIEYRFTPTHANIKVSVAQEVLSDSSDNTLDFTLVADGKVIAEKAVTFKQTADLTGPLAGVTVLKITVATKGTCRTSSTALITRAIVQG